MAKLLRIANQKDVLQLDFCDGKTPTWAKCPPAVKSFALQNLKIGDEVDVITETQNDGLHVTKIGKVGTLGVSQPAPTQEAPSGGGASGQPPKQQEAVSEKNSYRSVNPDTQRLIVHQSVMSSACTALQALVCQLPADDPNKIAEYICTVYNRLLAEVDK